MSFDFRAMGKHSGMSLAALPVGPVSPVSGVRIAWVRDPDRQVLSLFQPL
jgi:hypothetical protein